MKLKRNIKTLLASFRRAIFYPTRLIRRQKRIYRLLYFAITFYRK